MLAPLTARLFSKRPCIWHRHQPGHMPDESAAQYLNTPQAAQYIGPPAAEIVSSSSLLQSGQASAPSLSALPSASLDAWVDSGTIGPWELPNIPRIATCTNTGGEPLHLKQAVLKTVWP